MNFKFLFIFLTHLPMLLFSITPFVEGMEETSGSGAGGSHPYRDRQNYKIPADFKDSIISKYKSNMLQGDIAKTLEIPNQRVSDVINKYIKENGIESKIKPHKYKSPPEELSRIHKMLDDGMTSKQIRGTLTHLKRPTLYDMIKRYQDSKVAGGGENDTTSKKRRMMTPEEKQQIHTMVDDGIPSARIVDKMKSVAKKTNVYQTINAYNEQKAKTALEQSLAASNPFAHLASVSLPPTPSTHGSPQIAPADQLDPSPSDMIEELLVNPSAHNPIAADNSVPILSNQMASLRLSPSASYHIASSSGRLTTAAPSASRSSRRHAAIQSGLPRSSARKRSNVRMPSSRALSIAGDSTGRPPASFSVIQMPSADIQRVVSEMNADDELIDDAMSHLPPSAAASQYGGHPGYAGHGLSSQIGGQLVASPALSAAVHSSAGRPSASFSIPQMPSASIPQMPSASIPQMPSASFSIPQMPSADIQSVHDELMDDAMSYLPPSAAASQYGGHPGYAVELSRNVRRRPSVTAGHEIYAPYHHGPLQLGPSAESMDTGLPPQQMQFPYGQLASGYQGISQIRETPMAASFETPMPSSHRSQFSSGAHPHHHLQFGGHQIASPAPSAALRSSGRPSALISQIPSASFSIPQMPTASIPQMPSASFSIPQMPSASFSIPQMPSADIQSVHDELMDDAMSYLPPSAAASQFGGHPDHAVGLPIHGGTSQQSTSRGAPSQRHRHDPSEQFFATQQPTRQH